MTDPLVFTKSTFHEMFLWRFNKFVGGFQADNLMVLFLSFTLEGLLQWLLEKFILKETLAKAHSETKLTQRM